jgi:chromosome segregation ATPase
LTSQSSWLPELQRVVGLINASFGSNFSQIGCAGEVSLGQHEDYDKFSVQIRVKFRETEELQQLTGTRQSGGERSVSTILYLIALQVGGVVSGSRLFERVHGASGPPARACRHCAG